MLEVIKLNRMGEIVHCVNFNICDLTTSVHDFLIHFFRMLSIFIVSFTHVLKTFKFVFSNAANDSLIEIISVINTEH